MQDREHEEGVYGSFCQLSVLFFSVNKLHFQCLLHDFLDLHMKLSNRSMTCAIPLHDILYTKVLFTIGNIHLICLVESDIRCPRSVVHDAKPRFERGFERGFIS